MWWAVAFNAHQRRVRRCLSSDSDRQNLRGHCVHDRRVDGRAPPTGILASGFLEVMREQRRGRDQDIFGYCPHCGKQLLPGEELE